jgi:hypothetical protein
LARYAEHDGETLWRAIRATFDRCGTPIPDGVSFGLTEDFAQDRQKQIQWRAFLARNALEPVSLAEVLGLRRRVLMPALNAAKAIGSSVGHWPPDGDSR